MPRPLLQGAVPERSATASASRARTSPPARSPPRMATRARAYLASTSPARSAAACALTISAWLMRTTASVSPRRKAARTSSLKLIGVAALPVSGSSTLCRIRRARR
ncbi:hypothetical protein ACFQZ4_03670 [Catellatospora coxensis]